MQRVLDNIVCDLDTKQLQTFQVHMSYDVEDTG